MTTPKEALKVAKAYFKAECLNLNGESERNLYGMITDAIPVAELHEQAAELVKDGYGGIVVIEWWEKLQILIAKLEALK